MTVWTAHIAGRVISKKNGRRWVITPKGRRLIPSVAYVAFHRDAAMQLAGFTPGTPITGPIELELTVRLANREHEADLDNQIVGLADLLQDIGVFRNDRQVVRIVAEKQYGAASFSADVTVSSVVWDQEAA